LFMDIISTTVGIVRCPYYSSEILTESLQKLAEVCCTNINLRAARIVIKPNLISARRSPLACTEGRFILAAARLFMNHGARVIVGDSPAFGTTRAVLDKIGVLHALQKMAVPIADFTRVKPVILPSGLTTGLAAEALDCDLLVNLPRVKAHAQLRVTLAVKNYFGCVAGLRKPCWHMKYGGTTGAFEHHLVELLSVLPQSITFVDGITAMHRNGPISGEPFDLGIVACSANPVAADRALLEVIGLEPHASPLMLACIDAGITGIDLAELAFPILAPRDVKAENFEVPAELSPIRFSPFRFLKSNIKRTIMQSRASR
jgi:uncharacterized protein (DUF362 family)